jgi:hypothetical protein
MRLSEWRKAAPTEGAMNDRVLAVVGPVLADLGAERDPECWVAWGEEPDLRYSLLAPTLGGLITAAIRFTSPEDGPRVIAKLVRWSKVSVSELGLDAGGGHRMVAVQVENLVLKGMDEEADRICKFVRILIAGVDNRLQVPVPAATALRASVRTVTSAPAPVVVPGVARVVAAPRVAAPAAVAAGDTGVEAKRGAERSAASKTPKGAKPTTPRVAAKSAAPTLVPPAPAAPAAASGPAAPAEVALSPEQASPPTPIAARAAARHATADAAPAAPTKAQAGEPEPEPDRSGWVSPHPIEEQVARKPSKPRTWMP